MKKVSRVELIKTLEQELSYKRFIHTLSVAGTASSLAMCYGADLEKAETAGLLHDCAKCMDVRKMQKVCEKAGLTVSSFEADSGSLLHSKAGSVLAAEKYGITDPDMINAIRYHTTGRPGMSLLEKIIFVADYIEPGRFTAKNLPLIRRLAFSDIDEALMKILYDTLVYLNSTGLVVDPMTQKTYDYYKQIFEEKTIYD
ncbi:MAG: HD domain-containing protein [Sarcina sp.]|nr:HD domain-containing protein [Sarcina sp.]MDO5485535.1 bis(5'-nucleosyl)-tetraphosphatase (symmetrical) YqeK [Sarcina sp.]HAL58877.1 phosphodiesterase [Sarcina sp.]